MHERQMRSKMFAIGSYKRPVVLYLLRVPHTVAALAANQIHSLKEFR
jgi:hypothetical protein